MNIGDKVWMFLVCAVILVIGIQIGIIHGRNLQAEETVAAQWAQMAESRHGTRWVVTSRDTFPFLPGAEVFTIEDYVWHEAKVYVTVRGDTIASAVIRSERNEQ